MFLPYHGFIQSVYGIMVESVKCHLNQNTCLPPKQKIKQVIAEKLFPAATSQHFKDEAELCSSGKNTATNISFIGIMIIIFITHQGMALENDTHMTVEINYSPAFILTEKRFSISPNSTNIISKAATFSYFSKQHRFEHN